MREPGLIGPGSDLGGYEGTLVTIGAARNTEMLLDQRWNTFYRAYPWMRHRLVALQDLLKGAKPPAPQGPVTLDPQQAHEARVLLVDLLDHLERCYAADAHEAFRRQQQYREQRRPAVATTEPMAP